jgi:alpha-aminoadipic semialdehyde synthase
MESLKRTHSPAGLTLFIRKNSKGGVALNIIGVRKEDKPFETRVPLVPDDLSYLSKNHDITFIVEPSDQRAFTAAEFANTGVTMTTLKGSDASVILAIKEIPTTLFEEDKVYIFFSHTIKGQKYNMPMLKQIIDIHATLIDYERVVDSSGKRLIFFGNWAGMAGMSDTLRSLGERLTNERLFPNPFSTLKRTTDVKNLTELKSEFRLLGERIQKTGIPKTLTPFVVGFAGYGNVSQGAQEMFDILPHVSVTPEQLPNLEPQRNLLYKCIFKEEHMVQPIDTSAKFDLQDYYTNGQTKYKSIFHEHIPFLTVLMNCIYWTNKSPRLVTKDFIRKHWYVPSRKLTIIGDISCDIEGAIEFTLEATTPQHPSFTYLVADDRIQIGTQGDGPVVMAVDNLPCELPRESSAYFSKTLLKYIPLLANADFTVPFDQLTLPRELKDAVIVYRGKLTNNYQYLKQYL